MADKTTLATNRALNQKGCSYCRLFKPFDQVRTIRTRLGVQRAICDTCQKARRSGIGNQKER